MAVAVAAALGIGLLALLWRYIVKHPPCCDASGYMAMANAYLGWDAPADLVATLRGIRTYGYPVFLAPLLLAAKWLAATPALIVFLAQILLYWLVVVFLAREYGHLYGLPAGRHARWALLANVLVYPLLGIPLTDGFSVCLLLLLLALALRWLRMQSVEDSPAGWHLLHALPFGLLAGYALMVRPANLTFAGVPLLALLFIAIAARRKHQRAPDALLALLFVVGGFLLMVAPQIAINVMHFDRWTILPAKDLGSEVLEWGKQVLKYLTNLSGSEVQQCYRVPWPVPPGAGLAWYFQHPVTGFKTVALHLFGALDYDYLFTYVYNLKQAFRPLLFLYVHTCLFFGAAGLVARATEVRRARWGGPEFVVAASISYLVLWAGIQALAHAEVRYSIGIFTLLLLFLPRGWAAASRRRAALFSGYLAYLLVAWLLSNFLAGLMAGCFGK